MPGRLFAPVPRSGMDGRDGRLGRVAMSPCPGVVTPGRVDTPGRVAPGFWADGNPPPGLFVGGLGRVEGLSPPPGEITAGCVLGRFTDGELPEGRFIDGVEGRDGAGRVLPRFGTEGRDGPLGRD
jgi:hypothetical protein